MAKFPCLQSSCISEKSMSSTVDYSTWSVNCYETRYMGIPIVNTKSNRTKHARPYASRNLDSVRPKVKPPVQNVPTASAARAVVPIANGARRNCHHVSCSMWWLPNNEKTKLTTPITKPYRYNATATPTMRGRGRAPVRLLGGKSLNMALSFNAGEPLFSQLG